MLWRGSSSRPWARCARLNCRAPYDERCRSYCCGCRRRLQVIVIRWISRCSPDRSVSSATGAEDIGFGGRRRGGLRSRRCSLPTGCCRRGPKFRGRSAGGGKRIGSRCSVQFFAFGRVRGAPRGFTFGDSSPPFRALGLRSLLLRVARRVAGAALLRLE